MYKFSLFVGLLFAVNSSQAQERLAFNEGFLNLVSSRMSYNAGMSMKILIESKGEKWDNFPPDFRFDIERALEIAFKNRLISCDGPLKQVDAIVDWPRRPDGAVNGDSTALLNALSGYEAHYWPILEKWYVQITDRF